MLLEWHSLDHIALEESYAPVSANWDFFHINSVDLDGDGNLLDLLAQHAHRLQARPRRERSSGASAASTATSRWAPAATSPGSTTPAASPTGRSRIFDNGATPAVEKLSRGLILDVDEQAMTATLLRQYTHPRILSGSQGSVQLLANGNVFVGWGEAPHVSEFDRSGRMLFDAVLGEQYQSYRAFRLPWTGRPGRGAGDRAWPAAAATDRLRELERSDRRAQLAVARGRADRRSASPWLARGRAGFESALHTASTGPYFAVQALDAGGTPLGRSNIVAAPVLSVHT